MQPTRTHAAGAGLAIAALTALTAFGAGNLAAAKPGAAAHGTTAATATPVKHLVVIFDENISFDHYFGTYPYAPNPAGEPTFHAAPGTPTVNGLYSDITKSGPVGPLLTSNPNLSNPMRLDPADPMTCDQNHNYTAEQTAADHGAEDMYAQTTGRSTTLATCLAGLTDNGTPEPVPSGASTNYAVMDYYDGNTVTGLWNYAQHFAMGDNAYTTTFGPSTPGALNVTAAQSYGAICGPATSTITDSACAAPPGYNATDPVSSNITTGASGPTPVPDQPPAGQGTTWGDSDPTYDICSYLPSTDGGDNNTPANTLTMGGNNIGEELTTAKISWGWFEGGFDNGFVPGHGTPPTTAQICAENHKNLGSATVTDYIPHHEPFQYFASTANPMHLPPSSVKAIGHSDRADHQYDIADFWAAADAGSLPAVSYLKAPAYQDGHGGYSDPLDEQTWLTTTINHLESLPTWSSTAVVVTYDDSDGWYDSIMGPLQTQSQTSLDALTGTGQCGAEASAVPQNSSGQPEQGRCGVGSRIPFLVISSWARANYVDSTLIDQSSVVKFIEDNWHLAAMGNGAADTGAGSIMPMFDFHAGKTGPPNHPLFLSPSRGEQAAATRR